MSESLGIRIKWLSVTCFEMNFGSTTVVSDPFVTDSPGTNLTWKDIQNCDLITLSHSHWDHVTDIPPLMTQFDPLLLCGELTAMGMAQWLDCNPSRLYPMTPNLELNFGDVKVRALFGRHTDLETPYRQAVTKCQENPLVRGKEPLEALQTWGILEYRNYLFTTKNGTKVLLWGNDPTIEQYHMLKELQPDVAILQLSKQDPTEMGAFAAAIGAKVVIPHHMDLKQQEPEYLPRVETMERSYLSKCPDGTFLTPQHGKWMNL